MAVAVSEIYSVVSRGETPAQTCAMTIVGNPECCNRSGLGMTVYRFLGLHLLPTAF